MTYFVTGIDMAVSAAIWLALAIGCLLLYRRFRLPVLPWVAAYVVLAYLASNLRYWYFSRVVDVSTPRVDPHSTAVFAAMISLVIEDIGILLVAILLLAEVAVLAMRANCTARAHGLRFFVVTHAYTRALGITLVLLALASSLPAVIYYYTR